MRKYIVVIEFIPVIKWQKYFIVQYITLTYLYFNDVPTTMNNMAESIKITWAWKYIKNISIVMIIS